MTAWFAMFLKRSTKPVVWISTLVFSSVGAAHAIPPAPQQHGMDKWVDMRRELALSQSRDEVSDQVRRVLGLLGDGSDPGDILALSYSVARPSDIAPLDAFWAAWLARRGDTLEFATMVDVRSRAIGGGANARETYLNDWLYLANNGNYDGCGGGGGNCGVGFGNGGGDGTTNEGGGNGADPNGDGDQGDGNNDRPGNKIL